MSQVWILGGARTPFAAWGHGKTGAGSPGGALKTQDPFDLGAAALTGALNKVSMDPKDLDRVVFGNTYHVGPHACYGGRYAAHRAAVPPEVPAETVSMACGTGLAAVIAASRLIRLGEADRVGVAGADTTSLIRRDVFVPSFKDASCGLHIARTVELMARAAGVDRAAQDAFSLASHKKAREARRGGLYADEIVAVAGIESDDAILENPSESVFASADLLFKEEGLSVTSANTHGIVDGGSALLLASEEGAKAWGGKPLGRFVAGASAGTSPERMAVAAVASIRKVLAGARLSPADVDLYEVNETFAAQVLLDARELGVPMDRVNVNGGAIALGHPFAGTGGRLILTLLLELGRRGLKRGVAAISIGGGLGVAVLVERA